MTDENDESAKPVDPKAIETGSSGEPVEIDDLPSRPFKGINWSEHADVHG